MVGQTERGGAKDGPGPSPGIMVQLRWAVVWVCEGGGALYTHPLLAGQVWVAWHGGRMGWWE